MRGTSGNRKSIKLNKQWITENYLLYTKEQIILIVLLKYNLYMLCFALYMGFPSGSDGKVSACNVGGPGSIPGSGRSPGEGNGNPLQHSCLENPMNRGA